MSSSQQKIIAEWRAFRQFCMTEYNEGRCTQKEAAEKILEKAITIFQNLKVPVIDPEKDNLYQGVNYN